jgi:TolB-like protein/Tfp pilus assembly protein PilF
MSRLKRLIVEIHHRSLWQVLLIYVGAGWACFELIDAVTNRLGLPAWLPGLAIVLFLLALPIVLATAFVREESVAAAPTESTQLTEAVSPRRKAAARGRLSTWRNAALGFVVALAVWGVVATGWFVVSGRVPVTTVERKSVAVLPFANMSADPANEYFSDGITDDIITQLAKIADLTVISRTSVMQYKGTEKNVREIAEELGVTAILEGGVQRFGERVRINAQLINARSDAHLWAETYDRELTDVFTIQSDVAQRIATELQSTLTSVERERIQARPTGNVDAYDLYVQGRFLWNQRSGQGMLQAIDLFERAIELDSLYALAYAGLADTHTTLYSWAWISWEDASPWIDRASRRALELDPQLGEAHATRALFLEQQFDWVGAEFGFVRALELAPGYATGHHWYGLMLAKLGRFDEALAEIRRAAQLDPLSWIISTNLGWTYYFARDYKRAIDQLVRTVERQPDVSTYPWLLLSEAYTQVGSYPEAIAAAHRAVELNPHATIQIRLAYAYQKAGQTAEAQRILDEHLENGDPTRVALVYAAAGDTERAFESLERAFDERSPFLYELKVDPRYDPIRSDPRFAELLRRLGLE